MPRRRIVGVEVQCHAFFDLCTRWRWVVSFMTQLLYCQVPLVFAFYGPPKLSTKMRKM